MPPEAESDFVDGNAGLGERNGGGDAVGVRKDTVDVDTEVMFGVGVGGDAGFSHDGVDVWSADESGLGRV